MSHSSFLTLSLVMLLGAMLPGADFAIVTKNALLYSRRIGIYTALGIVAGMCIHMTYCVLGLAVIIKQSSILFHTIQYAGAAYLLYLSFMLLKPHAHKKNSRKSIKPSSASLSWKQALRQGFICNILNPKATLFFLTIFSAISTTNSSLGLNLLYALEMLFIALFWFCSLAYFISHQLISHWLNQSQKMIERILGIMLLGLAFFVIFWS